jgi:hypothetical protein
MTNHVYPKWTEALLQQAPVNKSLDQSDAPNGVYSALLTLGGGGYTYSSAHQFFSDLAGIQGTPQQVAAPTLNLSGNGFVFDGSDITYLFVTGTTISGLVLYRHNAGANTTWRLVFYYDAPTGFPITPNGGNVIISWSPSGIFAM